MRDTIQPRVENVNQNNAEVAANLARNGYRIFPANPATKQPMPGVKWKAVATDDADQIAKWWKQWPDAMPALPTGSANGVSVIDLDLHDGKDGIAAYRAQGLDPDDADFVVRTASGGLHLYFDHAEGVRNSATAEGIDVRGEGGYVIAPGAIAEAGEYRLERGSLDFQRLLGFGDWPAEFAPEAREAAPEQTTPGGYAIAELAQPLFFIPNDGSHDEWVRVLMALHHATGGSRAGLDLAKAWSADYPGFDPKEVAAKWRSFGNRDGDQITADTLFAEARKHGWNPVSADDFDDDDVDEPTADAPADAGGLTFLTPDECADLPPQDYLVKGLIAPGQVGCIFGEPGAGKSVIAPWLAYRVTQGEEAFGLRTKPGAAFYVACEDESGMAGRVAALRNDLGSADDFHLVRGCSDLFSPGKVEGSIGLQLKALVSQVRAVRPSLVIIDTLAMAMPGLEENDAAGMNRVVQIGKRLAKWGAAVVFVHHGTKADGSTPRGHSVFNGALDFSLMMKPADQNGVVRGAIRKNRNGPADLDIAFQIESRTVGFDVDGEAVSAPVCVPCDAMSADAGPKLTPATRAAYDLALEMMDAGPVTEAEWFAKASDGYRVSSSEKRDSRRTAARRALQTLTQEGLLKIGETGLLSIPHAVEDDEWDDDDDEIDALLS